MLVQALKEKLQMGGLHLISFQKVLSEESEGSHLSFFSTAWITLKHLAGLVGTKEHLIVQKYSNKIKCNTRNDIIALQKKKRDHEHCGDSTSMIKQTHFIFTKQEEKGQVSHFSKQDGWH